MACAQHVDSRHRIVWTSGMLTRQQHRHESVGRSTAACVDLWWLGSCLRRGQVCIVVSALLFSGGGCGKDPPVTAPGVPVPLLPGEADVAVAVPQINPPIADEEDELAPAGPAVEVNVADAPSQPLAYYRGTAGPGTSVSLLWSRKAAAKKAIAVGDGRVALRGDLKPADAVAGPAIVVGEGPLLVSIGADWCLPCSQELGDVLELASKVRPGKAKPGEIRLVMVLEGTPDEWPLAEVRDGLFAKHAKAKKLGKALAKPAWAEFRADIESSWGAAIDKLGVLGGSKTALPINLLLDRCGHIQAAASGSLNAAKKRAFLDQIALLHAAPCYPAPMAVPVTAPIRSAVPRGGADAGTGKSGAAVEAPASGEAKAGTEGSALGPDAGPTTAVPGEGSPAAGDKPLKLQPDASEGAATPDAKAPGSAVRPASAATETGKSGAKE